MSSRIGFYIKSTSGIRTRGFDSKPNFDSEPTLDMRTGGLDYILNLL